MKVEPSEVSDETGESPDNRRIPEAELSHSYDWACLVPRFIHPIKVGVLEALWYMGEPLSAADLEQFFSGQVYASLLDYHLRSLVDAGVVAKLLEPRDDTMLQNFYSLP